MGTLKARSISPAMSLTFAKNGTNATTITWNPEPSVRGSWSILSTCIITTSLCVWTAVHLNVPAHDQKYWQFWRKLYWLGVGLFAPEMVAYTAWYQGVATARGLKVIQRTIGHTSTVSWYKKASNRVFRGERRDRAESDKVPPSFSLSLIRSRAIHLRRILGFTNRSPKNTER